MLSPWSCKKMAETKNCLVLLLHLRGNLSSFKEIGIFGLPKFPCECCAAVATRHANWIFWIFFSRSLLTSSRKPRYSKGKAVTGRADALVLKQKAMLLFLQEVFTYIPVCTMVTEEKSGHNVCLQDASLNNTGLSWMLAPGCRAMKGHSHGTSVKVIFPVHVGSETSFLSMTDYCILKSITFEMLVLITAFTTSET